MENLTLNKGIHQTSIEQQVLKIVDTDDEGGEPLQFLTLKSSRERDEDSL